MGDSVLLPNGNVILLNGAMEGLAGDSASGGGSKAFYHNFFAEMYVTNNPMGQRWFTLSRSQIPRLYHSTAALTSNGTILVTGCDRCGGIITNLTFSPSPAKAEYRNEIFYPPPWYDFANKPSILSAPEEVQYGQLFTVSYSGLSAVNVSVSLCSAFQCIMAYKPDVIAIVPHIRRFVKLIYAVLTTVRFLKVDASRMLCSTFLISSTFLLPFRSFLRSRLQYS
jgi:hypothetical protein